MRWAAALVVVGACWTGDVPDPAAPEPPAPDRAPARPRPTYALKLVRTTCFGRCPAYTVEVDADGNVRWLGSSGVQVVGPIKDVRIPMADVRKLARAVDAAHFFELDETGHKRGPDCTREPDGTMSCSTFVSFCTDTSHAIVTVTRGDKSFHKVDDAHCGDTDPKLLELEQLIDQVTGTHDWIGR